MDQVTKDPDPSAQGPHWFGEEHGEASRWGGSSTEEAGHAWDAGAKPALLGQPCPHPGWGWHYRHPTPAEQGALGPVPARAATTSLMLTRHRGPAPRRQEAKAGCKVNFQLTALSRLSAPGLPPPGATPVLLSATWLSCHAGPQATRHRGQGSPWNACSCQGPRAAQGRRHQPPRLQNPG